MLNFIKTHAGSLICSVLLLSTVVLFFVFTHKNWQWKQVLESQKCGDEIIYQLQYYYSTNNRFPSDLELVLHNVADRCRQPIAGKREWNYSVEQNGAKCKLSFAASGIFSYEHSWASSDDGFSWKVDQ